MDGPEVRPSFYEWISNGVLHKNWWVRPLSPLVRLTLPEILTAYINILSSCSSLSLSLGSLSPSRTQFPVFHSSLLYPYTRLFHYWDI